MAVRTAPTAASAIENQNMRREVARIDTEAVTMAIWSRTSAWSKYGSRSRFGVVALLFLAEPLCERLVLRPLAAVQRRRLRERELDGRLLRAVEMRG